MVNSPSRPILRPDAPPAPVECGGRTPLWNRETCLRVDRTALPPSGPASRPGWGRLVPTILAIGNQTKSNHAHPHPGPLSRLSRLPRPANQGKNPSNQASSCLIKANQGKRQK